LQLNSAHNDKVWYAIVGLTKQFVSQQIDADNYNMFINKFQDEVLPLNQHSEQVTDVDGTILPSSKFCYLIKYHFCIKYFSSLAVDHGKITFEEEYRFMLYRHWSLYKSMYFSNYIAAKLGIWQSSGSFISALASRDSTS